MARRRISVFVGNYTTVLKIFKMKHLRFHHDQTRPRSHNMHSTGGLFTLHPVNVSYIYIPLEILQRLTLAALISADFHCCRYKVSSLHRWKTSDSCLIEEGNWEAEILWRTERSWLDKTDILLLYYKDGAKMRRKQDMSVCGFFFLVYTSIFICIPTGA